MCFSDVVDKFANSLPGTDAYATLRQDLQQLITIKSDAAAAYFMLSGFARTYVILYEDQEIKPEFAKKSQRQMLSYLNMVNDAIKTADKAALLDALNAVVSDYQQSDKVF